MGLSIYYSGSLRNENQLDELIEEVTEICNTLQWAPHYLSKNDENGMKGMCFAPEGCEPVFLSFLPGGRLCSPTNLQFSELYDGIQFEKELMYTTATKTQYAGPEAHIAVINLLKYVSEKYLKDFVLMDEGNYWETGDEQILYKQFEKYNMLLDLVADALGSMQENANETPVSLVERLEKILNEKLKGNRD